MHDERMLKSESPPLPPSALAGKYLTLRLDQETYGLGVLKIREIIRMQKITPVPRSPAHIPGVINLRGRVVPVVDLRVRFGLPAGFGDRTCIVVAQIQLAAQPVAQIGLIVDSVEDVIPLQASEISPTPGFDGKVDTSHLLGMAQVKGKVVTLLDIDRVIEDEAPVSLG